MMTAHRPAFDLVVCGSTAPGIVAAIRAAREGLKVALIAAGPKLGGSLPSLGAVETHYGGNRAPLLQEFIDDVRAHYRNRYGPDSAQYHACTGGKMLTFEPQVAEAVLEGMVAAEKNIRVWRGFTPAVVDRDGALVRAVLFRNDESGQTLRLAAQAFIEAGYEGDLMARAGAAHRIGREARGEFGEPRAGRVFTQWLTGVHPRAAAEGRLNLITAGATTSEPLPGSTGEGDDNIQSYSYRLCLTDDPANRRLLAAPPPGYERATYAPILLSPAEKEKLPLPFHHRFLIYSLREMVERDHIFHGHALPNRKRSWNATNFTGAGKGYALAAAAGRRTIERAHREHALGLMWFLQNDPEMPRDLRELARAWGLARDEFVETENLPPQLYVREARRLVGRAIFTELDALSATPPVPAAAARAVHCHPLDDKLVCHSMDDNGRAPVHADSVGITEFSLDSLACTTERLPGAGALCDGQLFQMEVSRPGQVPFGALLPRDIDNLLVVTTVAATHVAWGTIRQTPTLMHLAESAAWAVVLAARQKIAPAAVNIDRLQRTLVARGVMISFFNDFDMGGREPWVRAVQYFGARGFFPSYAARPGEVLDPVTATAWARAAGVPADTLAGLTRGTACQRCYEKRIH
ncbi:MAG: FAD-dependent oxidoreductase [Verrucomicrobia bacterium]|nr:FAD-dependent oxidoreductase [Verrucomicrobiota bacterium]